MFKPNTAAMTPAQTRRYNDLSQAAKRILNDYACASLHGKSYLGQASTVEARAELVKSGLAVHEHISSDLNPLIILRPMGKRIAASLAS